MTDLEQICDGCGEPIVGEPVEVGVGAAMLAEPEGGVRYRLRFHDAECARRYEEGRQA